MATKNITDPTGNEPLNYQSGWGSPQDPTTFEGMVFPPVTSGQASSHPLPPGVRRGERVITDIENKADYYSPELYRKLLTFFSSSQFEQDSNTDFIPISQTKANPKLFVVGLIPPSATVTGRLLDRSASIANATGWPDQELDFSGAKAGAPGGASGGGSKTMPIVTVSGYTIGQGTGKSDGVPGGGGGAGPNGGPPIMTRLSIPQLWNVLSNAYRSMYGKDATPTEMQFYVAQAMRETGGNLPNNNFGFVGNYPKPPEGRETFRWTNGMYFNSYATTEEGARGFLGHLRSQNVGDSARAGDVMGYMTSLAQGGYYGEPVEVYYHGTAASPKNGLFPALLGDVARGMAPYGVQLDPGTSLPAHSPDACAFRESVFAYRDRTAPGWNKGGKGGGLKPDNLFRFMPGSDYSGNCTMDAKTAGEPPSTNGAWAGSGSKDAAAAKAADVKKTDTDLNTSDIGKRFQAAQAAEAFQTAMLINKMRDTPPLRLLVNPKSFKISSEKICNDGNWTRNGHIIEHWGDQQDKLDASGTLAAFFAIDANSQTPDSDGSSPGLTRVARQYSESFQNFLSLYLLYKNNGYLFTSGLEQQNSKSSFFTRLSLVGSIYIYYDSTLYIGSFDNFNITETDDKPYTLEYNFQFTVRATFLLDRPDEYDYGNKDLFKGSPALSGEDALFQKDEEDSHTIVEVPPDAPQTIEEQWAREADEKARQEAFFASLPPSGDTTIDPAVAAATGGGQAVPKPTQAQKKGKK